MEVINRKVELLIENNESDFNPKYYIDEKKVQRRFYALCIGEDTISYRGPDNKMYQTVQRWATIFENRDQKEAELGRIGYDSIKNTYVDRIDKIQEFNHNRNFSKSYLVLKGMESVKKDVYHPSGKRIFGTRLPLHDKVSFYRVYNGEFGIPEPRFERYIGTMELFQMMYKISNGIELSSLFPIGSLEVKDLYDILGEKQDAKVAREERRSADLYRPVEYLRGIPSKLKNVIDRTTMGVNDLRNRLSVKRLLVYASVLTVLITGGAKGFRKYQLQNSPNGYDCLMFDERFGTRKDQDLQIQRDTYAPRIRELSDNKKTGLTLDEIEKTAKYLEDVVNTDFDRNASFNRINLPDLVSEKWTNLDEYRLQEKQRELAEKISNRFNACNYRPNDNNMVEVNNDKGKAFLDFAIPLRIFSEDYLSKPHSFTSYSSSNPNNPTTEEIKLYAEMPEILKATVNAQINEILQKVTGYNFMHPSVTPTGDPKTFNLKEALDYAERVVNARLLAQASDAVIEEAERARAHK